MIPSSCSDLIAANCLPRGTFGSMRCSCQSPICSRPTFDCLLMQIFRPTIGFPLTRTGPPQSRLGGDKNSVIGIKCFTDELLRDIRPIGVGAVDEIDPELGNSLEGSDRLCSIDGRTPDTGAGEAHRPEAEAVDLGIAADFE